MKRRDFMRALSAVGLARVIPIAGPRAAAAAPVYSRYMYGLGVFQARTRANLDAVSLGRALAIPSDHARMMLGEMARNGLVTQSAQSSGVVRALSHHMNSDGLNSQKPNLQKLLDWIDQCDAPTAKGQGCDQMMADDGFANSSNEAIADDDVDILINTKS